MPATKVTSFTSISLWSLSLLCFSLDFVIVLGGHMEGGVEAIPHIVHTSVCVARTTKGYWGTMETFLLRNLLASSLPCIRNSSLAARLKFSCNGLVVYNPIV